MSEIIRGLKNLCKMEDRDYWNGKEKSDGEKGWHSDKGSKDGGRTHAGSACKKDQRGFSQ